MLGAGQLAAEGAVFQLGLVAAAVALAELSDFFSVLLRLPKSEDGVLVAEHELHPAVDMHSLQSL